MMINWQDIITTLGGQGLFLVAAAWVIKKLVSDRMAREAEEFKAELKANADVKIEQIKSILQMAALEHQVRFTRLHERRGEVIFELYKRLLEAHDYAMQFIYKGTGDPDQERSARDKMSELYGFVELNQLYLPSSVYLLLKEFQTRLRDSVILVTVYWTRAEFSTTEMRQRKNEVIREASTTLETDLPALRHSLEAEFRTLLGVADPGAATA